MEPLEKARLLKSVDTKSTGVIHKVITKEVATVRNGTRLWYYKSIIHIIKLFFLNQCFSL